MLTAYIGSVTSIQQFNGNGSVNGDEKFYETAHNLGEANRIYLQLSISEKKFANIYNALL